MELATKQYRVSIPGKECRKCVHYKRPKCSLTSTFTWEKNVCESWVRKNGGVDMGCDPWVEAEIEAKKKEKESTLYTSIPEVQIPADALKTEVSLKPTLQPTSTQESTPISKKVDKKKKK